MDVVEIVVVVLVAAVVRGTFGFGDSLVAMPLLTVALGLKTAAPLIGLTSVVFAVAMVVLERRSIDFSATKRLLPWILLGIPVGIFALVKAPGAPIKIAMGVALIAYGVYSLLGPRLPELRSSCWAAPFGLLSGAFGGAFNSNGPPIVIYGTMKRWPPETFRATLQANFLATNAFIAAGHGVSGLWTGPVLGYFALAVPILLVGLWIGARLAKRIPREQFTNYLMILLILLGILMLASGISTI